jgi:biopolymer transport protein ExbD
MKFKLFQGELEEEPGLPMTSLIDIVFLLLIFYISVSRIQQMDAQLSIRLPTAKSSDSPQRTIGDVVINVRQDGQIVVNSQPLKPDELASRLTRLAELFPGQSVIIRSDQRTEWKNVCTALDACAAADIWNIKFAVVPIQPTGAP